MVVRRRRHSCQLPVFGISVGTDVFWQSRRLDGSDAFGSTNRVGSCRTAALGHIFHDGVARHSRRLQQPWRDRAVN